VKLHMLLAQVTWPLATAAHAFVQLPQWLRLTVVSTHVPPHSVGSGALHAAAHAYDPGEPAQTGALDMHTFMHAPQLAVCDRSVSQPSSWLPLQSPQPGAHEDAGNEQAPAAEQLTEPVTCGSVVQSFPQVPQLWMSLGTQPVAHSRSGGAQTEPSGASGCASVVASVVESFATSAAASAASGVALSDASMPGLSSVASVAASSGAPVVKCSPHPSDATDGKTTAARRKRRARRLQEVAARMSDCGAE
jgi:hypothetical protein